MWSRWGKEWGVKGRGESGSGNTEQGSGGSQKSWRRKQGCWWCSQRSGRVGLGALGCSGSRPVNQTGVQTGTTVATSETRGWRLDRQLV